MRRFVRIALIILAVLAAVAASLVVAIFLLPETDLIRNNVQQQLSELTGQRVFLGAMKISPSATNVVRLSLEGISVQTIEGKELFSADRIVLSPRLAPLLRGEAVIDAITVERFRTAIKRLPDGAVQFGFLPIPGIGERERAPGEAGGKGASVPESQGSKELPGKPTGERPVLKWIIENVYLVDGRIDLIDQQTTRGHEIVIPFHGINGRLHETEGGAGFSVDLSAQLGQEGLLGNDVNLDGTVSLSADQSSPVQVRMELSSESLDLQPFYPYFPSWAEPARKLDLNKLRAQLNWNRGHLPLLSFEAVLKEKSNEAARVDVEGLLIATEDFSELKEIRASGETVSLPLKFFGDTLGPTFPLDPHNGVLKGSIRGRWTRKEPWSVDASLVLENAKPRGFLAVAGHPLRLCVQAKLRPTELLLENLEILGPKRLASVGGTIGHPFSKKPMLDLSGEMSFQPQWAKALGIKLPDKLTIEGRVPVRGRVRGRIDNLWFDVTGQATRARIVWAPYLEKPAGKRGSLSLKGKWLPARTKTSAGTYLNAVARVDMAGARLRLTPRSRWLSPAFVHFDAKVSVKGTKIDVKNAGIGIRRGIEGREFVEARGDFMNLGSPDPRISGHATIMFDRNIITLAELDSLRDLEIKGNAPLKIRFAGPVSDLNWSLDIPLTHLDISAKNVFRKPGGVRGSLTASGTLAGKELTLEKSLLTLPGMAARGQGVLSNRHGKFQGLTVDLLKGNVSRLLRYVPAAHGSPLSGSLEASLSLKPAKTGVLPAGSVRLIEVNYRPRNASWSLEKMKGVIDFRGDSVVIPEITGRVAGLIRGPLTAKGSLKRVTSLETLKGQVSVNVGNGRIEAGRLMAMLNQARLLVGTLLDPQVAARSGNLLDFNSLTCDFRVESGVAKTDNLKLKGPEIGVGAMGDIRLDTFHLDMLVGLHTVVVAADALAKIPAVKDFLKKHEGLLKITGLDKEMKRLGIKVPGSGKTNSGQPGATRTPVTVIVKLVGPASAPEVTPVLEATLAKHTRARLKSLMQ
ncbi:MAG: AsmA-like C-terminal region-containing protein [Deltaproteobacteria bacterium]